MLREDADNDETTRDTETDLPPFDAQKYRDELGDMDITEDQATEFLRSLDFILRTFVDLGWGVDSVQNFIPALKEFSSLADADALEQKKNISTFNGAAMKKKDDQP